MMGPITIVDKSTLQALSGLEAEQLSRFYSLVLPPILIREILSMLAKAPSKKKNWEAVLSSIARKVTSHNSYVCADAKHMAQSTLLGHDLPMDGRIPLPGGKRLRSRDGSYGMFYDEAEEKKHLRAWANNQFSEYYRATAAQVREFDQGIDLNHMKQIMNSRMMFMSSLDTRQKLLSWIDSSVRDNPEFHFELMCRTQLPADKHDEVRKRWNSSNKNLSEFAGYSFYFNRINLFYMLGLHQGLISTSKDAKTHLDTQYLYYLPFCMTFVSSDKYLLETAELFRRPDQKIINGDDLKIDLKKIAQHLSEPSTPRSRYFRRPPEEVPGLTLSNWKQFMKSDFAEKPIPKSEQSIFSAEDLVSRMNEAVLEDSPDQASFKTLDRNLGSLEERSEKFASGVFNILDEIGTDWNDIKSKFDSTHVKKIYDLHADLWHPSDKFKELAGELSSNKKSKYFYVGGFEIDDAFDQIINWSLHFEQILIPNPFPSPWSRKNEFNPLAQPTQYELDSLKLCFFMTLIAPLLITKKVVLVPSPVDYRPSFARKWHDIAAMKKTPATKIDRHDIEKLVRQRTFMMLRSLSRLDDVRRLKSIQAEFGSEHADEIMKLTERMRKKDPLCIDRTDFSGDFIQERFAEAFETSLLMCALYGALPITTNPTRAAQFQNVATVPTPVEVENLNKRLHRFPLLKSVNAELNAQYGEIIGRTFFQEELTQVTECEPDKEREDFFWEQHLEETSALADKFAAIDGIKPEQLIADFEVRLMHSKDHFLSAETRELIGAYDPELIKVMPSFAIALPASRMPDLPV